MSKPSLINRLLSNIRLGDQWLKQTPERSLEQAYDAALKIRKIEEEHFQGESILLNTPQYSGSSLAYFRSELKRHLTTAKVRLAEFRLSYSIVSIVSPDSIQGYVLNNSEQTPEYIEQSEIILEKLRFIDQVVVRYTTREPSKSMVTVNPTENGSDNLRLGRSQIHRAIEDTEYKIEKVGILPRSILGTLSQIQKNLDPEAIGEVVEDFRTQRSRNLIALRFIVLLIVLTIGSQIVSKTFLIGPIVDQIRSGEQVQIFINEELEERGFEELQRYEEKLKFQAMIGQIEPLSQDQLEAKIQKKAQEVAEDFRNRGSDAIKNVFADIFSAVVFTIFLLVSRQEIEALKLFMDRIIYGLSDSAKAFIIILVTDTFLGYHSPHGWEVLLETTANHFGVAANERLISLFIATVPVLLDTVFKYWIFRYLNRVSPSAVSVLKTMNET